MTNMTIGKMALIEPETLLTAYSMHRWVVVGETEQFYIVQRYLHGEADQKRVKKTGVILFDDGPEYDEIIEQNIQFYRENQKIQDDMRRHRKQVLSKYKTTA